MLISYRHFGVCVINYCLCHKCPLQTSSFGWGRQSGTGTAHNPALVLAVISHCIHPSREIKFCTLHFSSSIGARFLYSYLPLDLLILTEDLSLPLPLTSFSQTLIYRMVFIFHCLSIVLHTSSAAGQSECPFHLTQGADQTSEDLELLASLLDHKVLEVPGDLLNLNDFVTFSKSEHRPS